MEKLDPLRIRISVRLPPIDVYISEDDLRRIRRFVGEGLHDDKLLYYEIENIIEAKVDSEINSVEADWFDWAWAGHKTQELYDLIRELPPPEIDGQMDLVKEETDGL